MAINANVKEPLSQKMKETSALIVDLLVVTLRFLFLFATIII